MVGLSTAPAPEDTQDDYLLAQMLQLEYDKEHDLRLQAEEKHFNKHSKGQYCTPYYYDESTPYHTNNTYCVYFSSCII